MTTSSNKVTHEEDTNRSKNNDDLTINEEEIDKSGKTEV